MTPKPERYTGRSLSPARRKQLESMGLGAVDAAAVMSYDPNKSAYTLWAEKTGLLMPESVAEEARLNRELERYMARRFQEATGKAVRRVDALIQNPAYPWAYAWSEFLVLGENAGLTCASFCRPRLSRFGGCRFPRQYYHYCLHQMMVTGRKKWYLAVLTPERNFHIFPLEEDPGELSALATAEERFWRRVTKKEPPPPDGSPSTLRTLERLYPHGRERSVDLSPVAMAVHDYIRLWQKSQEAAQAASARANTIKSYLAGANHGHLGSIRVHWQPTEGETARQFQVCAPDTGVMDELPCH